MPKLIDRFEQRYRLGVMEMDSTHREFVDLVNHMSDATKEAFIPLFAELLAHTQSHFETENAMMRASGFPAMREHLDEHQRVLGDLRRFSQRVATGNTRLGRAYVTQQLPGWFDLHAKTMDSALAAHINHLQPDRSSQ